MATVNKLRYSISEEEHTASWQAGVDPDYDEAPQAEYEAGADAEYEDGVDADYDLAADPDYDAGADPEYEQGADPDYEEVAQPLVPEVVAEPIMRVSAPATGFAFELGRPVVPATQQQAHPVLWRGLLKERHPATGLVQRVPVYRLADGYWDCYREEELQAA